MKIILRLLLVALGVFTPLFSFGFEVGSVMSVVSLLFAILAGFFIAAATSNYLRYQSLIAAENASLITIAQLAKEIDPGNFERVAEEIDAYMVATLDADLLNYHRSVSGEFESLLRAIALVDPGKSALKIALQQNLHTAKANIVATWQETYLTAQTIMAPLHWMVIGLLASLTSILLLALRDGTLVAGIICGILILGIFEILELTYTIDTNAFLATKLAYESPQQIFSAIGRPNYYPESAIAGKKKHKLLPKIYRVGIVSASGKREIKTIGESKKSRRNK